jgi:hypothetical protein
MKPAPVVPILTSLVAFILPTTSRLYPGEVVPMPTLPLLVIITLSVSAVSLKINLPSPDLNYEALLDP